MHFAHLSPFLSSYFVQMQDLNNWRDIDSVEMHPNYTLDSINDIALVRVTVRFDWSFTVKPACLPSSPRTRDFPSTVSLMVSCQSSGSCSSPEQSFGKSFLNKSYKKSYKKFLRPVRAKRRPNQALQILASTNERSLRGLSIPLSIYPGIKVMASHLLDYIYPPTIPS